MRISDWSSDVCSSDLVAMNADIAETDRRAVARCLVNTGPQAIAFFMEVARHIERDRFDEDDDALLLARQPHAFAEHLRRIAPVRPHREEDRSEEHTSELQSLMRNPYAASCLQKH